MNDRPEPTPQGDAYRPFPSFAEWCSAPFDPATVNRVSVRLEDARSSVDESVLEQVIQTATNYAAIDTGAIEGLYNVNRGFTRTMAASSAMLETIGEQRGDHTRNAVEDALNGYDFVLDFATSSRELGAAAVRELHATLVASQDSFVVHTSAGEQRVRLPKGEFKSSPNNPSRTDGSIHHFAPPSDTRAELHRLLAEVSGHAFAAAHPVLQASYMHYAFVAIHPFADGNGRVSRALASIYSYRAYSVPLVIFADQKDHYLDALEGADSGNPRLFIDFVRDRLIEIMEISIQLILNAASGDQPGDALAALRSTLRSPSGPPHADMDELAGRLLEVLEEEASKQLAALDLPTGISSYLHKTGGEPPITAKGYRTVASMPAYLTLNIDSSSPARVSSTISYAVYVRTTAEADTDLVLLAIDTQVTPTTVPAHFEARVVELSPVTTTALRFRVASWTESRIGAQLRQLDDRIQKRLRDAGYS